MKSHLHTDLMDKSNKHSKKMRSYIAIGMTEARGIRKWIHKQTIKGYTDWFFGKLQKQDALEVISTL